jgi:hypothetical protein
MLFRLQRAGTHASGLPEGKGQDAGRRGGHSGPCSWNSGGWYILGVKKLVRPTETVAPADVDFSISDYVRSAHSDNTILVSVVTMYQLVRHLTAPITLSESIKTTAMVDSDRPRSDETAPETSPPVPDEPGGKRRLPEMVGRDGGNRYDRTRGP